MRHPSQDVAVVGIACRFPGAEGYVQFWENLEQGVNSIREITPDRWDIREFYSPNIEEPNKTNSKWCGLVDNIFDFDHQFFSISPREAINMDPQQRLLLEETQHCIEDSGIPLRLLQQKKTSVFVGVMTADYLQGISDPAMTTDSYAALGNFESLMANRVSYTFDLQGASQPINAACASSIIAIHEAKRALVQGDCDYALASCVNLNIHPLKYISFSKSRMLSPDGQCKTFDKDANGYVPGDGIGVLLLQRLDKAIEDGNHIYGIIKGSAINHTGRGLSITAPRMEAQREVILSAYRDAGITPDTVSYIEAHGTGTSLGDPIEVEALTQAFRTSTDDNQFCKIGSVKTNIGHLESAAGMAGVIKVLMMMKHKKIPKSLNMRTLNPIIDFETTPFTVSTSLQEWKRPQEGVPLRAGVSSFGFGGVNSHVLIEEYIEARTVEELTPEQDSYFFLLSAKNKHSLEKLVGEWQSLAHKQDLDANALWNLSHTLITGRESYPFRVGKLIRNQADLREFLQSDTSAVTRTTRPEWRLHVTETPWSGYAELQSLYTDYRVFRQEVDRLVQLLEELRVEQTVIQGFCQDRWSDANRSLYTFMATYAYNAALIELGVSPKLVVGEKSGLHAALAISGILDVKDLLAVLSGKMELSQASVHRPSIPFFDQAAGKTLTPAQIDSEYVTLLLQGLEEIPTLENAKVIERYILKARLLYDSQFTFKKFLNDWQDVIQKTSRYDLKALLFNEELLTSGTERYKQELRLLMVVLVSSLRKLNQKWDLRDAQLLENPGFYELIDLLEGNVMPKELFMELLTSDYPNTAQAATVLHDRIQGVDTKLGFAVLRAHNQRQNEWFRVEEWLQSAGSADVNLPAEAAKWKQVELKVSGDGSKSLKETLLALWLEGGEILWDKLVQEHSFRKVSLPGYPFKRDTFRLASDKKAAPAVTPSAAVSPQPAHPAPSQPPIPAISRPNTLLSKQWVPTPAAGYKDGRGTVAILTASETEALAAAVAQLLPQDARILHLDQLQAEIEHSTFPWENYAGVIDLLGCTREESQSLVYISWLQKFIEFGKREELLLLGVTRGLEPFQNQALRLSGSARAGLYRMLQSEYRHIRSRHMDGEAALADRVLAEQIVAEFRADSEDTEVCYRDGQRYRSQLVELQGVPSGTREASQLAPNEVLLITGGTRGLGFLCAQHFVKHYGAKKLVLTGRETLPPRDQWQAYAGQTGSLAEKLQAIQELERQGVEVRVWPLPLTDARAVQANIEDIKRTVGPIGGVIHCAGSLDRDNPAFIRKSLSGIETTLGPKAPGADYLYASVKNEPLRFLILFSSVSAVLPTLAAGVSDYGMANAHLDYFAHTVPDTFPLVAIQWPSWKEAGMGEFKNAAYEQTGLLSITNEEGLLMLDRILAVKPARVVLPAVYNPELWKPEKLMQRTLKEAKPSGIQAKQPAPEVPAMMNRKELIQATQEWLVTLFSKEMNIDASEFESDIPFQDYGMDSILLAQVVTRMDRELKTVAMDPSVLLENPTMTSLADYLANTYPEVLGDFFKLSAPQAAPAPAPAAPSVSAQPQYQASAPAAAPNQREQIAVVGLACQFPDAPNARVYWDNLINRRDSMREVPKSRWDIQEHYHPNEFRDDKSISKWGAFLPDIEQFDPDYFHIPESLAVQVDPLQRKFLEVGAEAIADAGYGKKDLWNQQVGVFVGTRVSNFHQKLGKNKKETIIATGQNFIAAHVSHVFNFKGPNMVIDSACSSSLTAVHLAAKSILHGECDMALAGGVEILLDETMYLTLSAAHVLSPDGRCKTFSANANGIGLGEGCGVLLLKRLSQAIQDGNKIYGIIDGSAINNDGNTMGITTPNPEAQKELIEKAIADARIQPESINYVETHGTGTLIGDPIELKALTQVFSKYTTKRQFCGVGSVKSNIGHLLSAAGMASLIKILLSLSERKLPSTLHCEEPNPRFQFQDSPFYIVQQLQHWTSADGVLRAGVSAFGLGGNNAHVLVSNEGVPASLQATLERTQTQQLFKKKRYWPWPEQTETVVPSEAPTKVNRESEFMSFFDSFEDDGRNE